MTFRRRSMVLGLAALIASPGLSMAQTSPSVSATAVPASVIINVDAPAPIPAWALAERAVIAANAEGVQGLPEGVRGRARLSARPRTLWHHRRRRRCGRADPQLADRPRPGRRRFDHRGVETVWENHLDQYSRARVPEVASVSEGIYYREFMPQFDWEHISEGMAGFYFYGLSRPDDPNTRSACAATRASI
jgi:hypothetical protein